MTGGNADYRGGGEGEGVASGAVGNLRVGRRNDRREVPSWRFLPPEPAAGLDGFFSIRTGKSHTPLRSSLPSAAHKSERS